MEGGRGRGRYTPTQTQGGEGEAESRYVTLLGEECDWGSFFTVERIFCMLRQLEREISM